MASSDQLTARHLRLLVLLVLGLSAFLRWRLADYADWGVDEAATLWLGTGILDGTRVGVGLFSSRGIPNLVGAPLLAAPLALLPDLLSISRLLSIVQLFALATLGLALGHRGGSRVTAVGILVFFPALVLSSFSLWNQYLTVPLTAMMIVLMLYLADGRGGPAARGAAVVAFAFLALFQPAIHLASFTDLVVHFVLLLAILLLRPRPMSAGIVVPGLLLVGGAMSAVYVPWLVAMSKQLGFGVGWLPIVIGTVSTLAAVVITFLWRSRSLIGRLAAAATHSRVLTWLALAALAFLVSVSAVLPLAGAQPGRRLLKAHDAAGVVLLLAQAGMVGALVPALYRLAREARRGTRFADVFEPGGSAAGATALLIVYPVLLVATRLVAEPTLLIPRGRSDLLLPLLPALLAPLIVVAGSTRRYLVLTAMRLSGALAGVAFLWLATTGFSAAFRKQYPSFVPPSEMCEAVDWVAARHREQGGGELIDLGYDLDRGLEWIPRGGCRPGATWYSIGRAYDWLLRRRYRLRNSREGSCQRRGGSGFQFGNRLEGPTPPSMVAVATLDHLEIRVLR